MTNPHVLAIVQAGGAGGRLDVLTTERPKPVLRFGGSYRLIDFALSNLMHSDIDDVWVSVAYQGAAIVDAVHNGRPWDLDRTYSGMRIVAPQDGLTPHESGASSGNADELYTLRDRIRAGGCDVVLVLSADHAYRCDYRELVATHRAKGAQATILTTEIDGVTGVDASDHAVLEVNRLSRVTGFSYKPKRPASSVIAVEAIVYDAAALVEVLEELHREINATTGEGGDTPGLGDYGDALIPRLVERGAVYAHPLDGYWRDLGQPHHYLNAHLELVASETDLFDPRWPVVGPQPLMLPARVTAEADIKQSLLSPGCVVEGTVTRSVLAPAVTVEPGAEVYESVLGDGVTVRSGAKLWRCLVDAGAEIGPNGRVGSADCDLTDPVAIAIVGRDSVVDSTIPAGGRLYPGTTV